MDGSYLISVGNYRENALVLWDMSNFAVHTVAKVGFISEMETFLLSHLANLTHLNEYHL